MLYFLFQACSIEQITLQTILSLGVGEVLAESEVGESWLHESDAEDLLGMVDMDVLLVDEREGRGVGG